jgi:hypothetical protein
MTIQPKRNRPRNTVQQRSIASIIRRVKKYLVEEGHPPAHARRASEAYRLFWELKKCFPQETLLVTHEIDQAWHAHLRRPLAYERDCLGYFDGILPHETKAAITAADQRRSARLWFSAFGLKPKFAALCKDKAIVRYS